MFETRSNSRFCNMVSVGPQPRLRRGRAQSPAPVPSTTPDTKRGLPREPGHRRSAPLASSASPHTCSRHDRRPPSTSRRGGDRRAQRLLQSPAFERRIDAGRRVAPRCLAGGGGKRIPVRRHRAHGNTAAGRAEDGRGAPGSRPVEGRQDTGRTWRQHRTSRCTVAGASATVGMVLSRAGAGV
jgi:hypothetical protein